MQNNPTQNPQNIPDYLQCEPRKYNVKLNHWHEDTVELEFSIIVKCTDQMLHEHNNFWTGAHGRLCSNNGDIVAVILKLIGEKLFWYCCENCCRNFTHAGLANEIFQDEGWSADCFEIYRVFFDNHVDDDDFEFEPVLVQGESS